MALLAELGSQSVRLVLVEFHSRLVAKSVCEGDRTVTDSIARARRGPPVCDALRV